VTVNHHVRGSSPRWGAIKFKGLQILSVGPFCWRGLWCGLYGVVG
jgi:hypothetical protein